MRGSLGGVKYFTIDLRDRTEDMESINIRDRDKSCNL